MIRKPSGQLFCMDGIGNFAKELVTLGHDVTMFGQEVEIDSDLEKFDIEANGIKTISFSRRISKLISYLILYYNALKTALHSDFVYVFYPTSYRYFILLCSLLRIKYGLYIRGTVGIFTRLSKFLYMHANVICTVSDAFTERVNKIHRENIAQTIKPMISYNEQDIIRREYNCPKSFNILFLGRVEIDKGISELLRAIKVLKEKSSQKFSLTIVGEGGFLTKAKEIVESLGISANVKFTGAIRDKEEKKKIFMSANLFILPSYHEGFPRTLYEAMIYGVPIITTMVGGIPSLMRNNYNCLAIEAKSVESIVNNVEFAMNNYSIMARYAMEASKIIAPIISDKKPSHARLVHTKIIEI